jgi:hypothetical protein
MIYYYYYFKTKGKKENAEDWVRPGTGRTEREV